MTRYFCFELEEGTPVSVFPESYDTRMDAIEAHPFSKVVGISGTSVKRKPYRWGKTDSLVNMKIGETMEVPYRSESDYGAWRSIASTLKSWGSVSYTIARKEDKILITRVK